MKPLNDEARKALLGLDPAEPSAADEQRVRARLERTLGVALPVAAVATGVAVSGTAAAATQSAASGAMSGTAVGGAVVGGAVVGGAAVGVSQAGGAGAVATGAFTSLSVGAKVVLFVAAVGLGSVTTYGVKQVVTTPPTPEPVVVAPAPVVVARAVVPTPTPVPTQAEPEIVEEPAVVTPTEPTAMPAPRVRKTGATKPVAEVAQVDPAPTNEPSEAGTPDIAPPPPPPLSLATAKTPDDFTLLVEVQFKKCDGATEGQVARGARRLLLENHPEHALMLLGSYQKQCVSGQWSDEAWRVRLTSLCRLDRDTEAQTLFEWFVGEYPARRAAIEQELRQTCEPSVIGE